MPKSASTTSGEPRPTAAPDEATGDVASRVDGGEGASVSFAATGDGPGSPAQTSRSVGHEGHARVGVGPGFPGAMLLGGRTGLLGMNPFPIVGSRIHPPLHRADTLSRARLNDWLDEAATGRVALIVAEAGFGKTTLLGDWARHSPRLTAWYRLDPDDRDWLTFSRHLVASGRELDPEFAPDTYALLMQLGPGGPTRADIQASLVREFAEFAATHPQGLTLIFDDYHAVDGSDEVIPIVRALIAATGHDFSVVIASRSTPQVPLGRLRARGDVSRISGEALRFDAPETDRLFRDAYGMPLDSDVVDKLVERTEGWAALLSLVNVGLGDQPRPDVRGFVSQLSATTGDLYAFLAEEVVASLPTDLHAFLTRASLLMWIDVASARVVAEADPVVVEERIASAERLGLLTRPDREAPHRFHPLVRSFLLAELTELLGDGAIRQMHERVGKALERTNWAAAAWHYRAAGNPDAAARAIDAAVESIFAEGSFELARPFLDGSAGSRERGGALILRSRMELTRGNYERSSELAEQAVDACLGSKLAGQALLNMSSILGFGGFDEGSVKYAEAALSAGLSETQQGIAEATIALWECAREGPLDRIADELVALASQQEAAGQHRFAGITRLNLSSVLLWLGRLTEAEQAADRSQLDLGGGIQPSAEFVSAVIAQAYALEHMGDHHRARLLMDSVLHSSSRLGRDEALLEASRLESDLGDLELAAAHLAQVSSGASPGLEGLANLCSATIAIRRGDVVAATSLANELEANPCRDAAGLFRGRLLRARAGLQAGPRDIQGDIKELRRLSTAQHSMPCQLLAELLAGIAGDTAIDSVVTQLGESESYLLSYLAEEMVRSIDRLSEPALGLVSQEAMRRPNRWINTIREAALRPTASRRAVRLMADIGGTAEASMLRAAATRDKSLRDIASEMTRRLAARVEVDDLGVVALLVGGERNSRRVRRKVLGLLCFVASRPLMAATRDEALDALWPDLAPATAVNSLHQTIYFLRRLLEPEYREGLSAGYLQFDGEVLRLDPDLVDTASRRCWRKIGGWQEGDETQADELVVAYRAKFALDFSYEDWAQSYRENLHAAVLSTAEARIDQLLSRGESDHAAQAAQALLRVDPTADAIELQLLKAYKIGGRHAAAAEQYAHYASIIRDELGADPPALADI